MSSHCSVLHLPPASQGLDGTFTIAGTVWSGPELSNVAWTSNRDDTRIETEHVAVHYQPWRWVTDGTPGILRSLVLREVAVGAGTFTVMLYFMPSNHRQRMNPAMPALAAP